MSSSDTSPRGFLTGFFALACAAVLAGLLLTMAVDPFGALSPAYATPTVCPPGIKSGRARIAKMMVPALRRPRTIIMGTSRVMLGFDQTALSRLGPDIANLGIENAQAKDMLALAKMSIRSGRLETVYIGIDYTAFYGRPTPNLTDPMQGQSNASTALLGHALFSTSAVRAALIAASDCTPRFTVEGAPAYEHGLPIWLKGYDFAAHGVDDMMANREQGILTMGRADARERDEQFRQILRLFNRQGISAVVFIAPYSQEVRQLMSAKGLDASMAEWVETMERISIDEGAGFADFTTPQAIADLQLPSCGNGDIACHYMDHIHYSPVVARPMASCLAEIAAKAHRQGWHQPGSITKEPPCASP